MSDIHGREVHNLGEHPTAGEFLKHPENKHVVEGYLEEAAKRGKADFFAGSERYEIRSEDTEGGEKKFSLHKHH